MNTQYILPFETPRRPKWTDLARSPLMALEQRKDFLTDLKRDRTTIVSTLHRIGKEKERIITQGQSRYEALVWDAVEKGEKPPQKPYLTAYVAEHLEIENDHDRARLRSFLRTAYRNSRGERWEKISDAELFNTARRVYRKLDGVACLKLDTLMQRVVKDREQYERLGHVIPLVTGIGFDQHVATDEATGKTGLVHTPMFMVGYSTAQQFWVAYNSMLPERVDEIGAVRGKAQVEVAKRHLAECSTVLAEHYQSRVNGLEIRIEPMDPKKRFEI